MEQRIHIVTDSSCDLPQQLVDEYEITVVPLSVHFGPETYDDGDLSPDEFWRKAEGPHHPKTSQPPSGLFETIFERLVEQGKQALCLTVTSKHSGTFGSAYAAAQRFGDAVELFDSLSLSLGLGIQALTAAQAARAGSRMEEILAALEALRERARLTIVLDTLENLRRGGRADAFIAAVDRMTQVLNIKVIINVIEGQLRLLGAARSFERALRRIYRIVEELGPLEHLAVVHTRRQELAEELRAKLAATLGFPEGDIWLRETGPALASHAGPGVVGVLAIPQG